MLKFTEEKLCQERGYYLIAGIDEVGRGCLAGPVVASAVILPLGKNLPWFKKIRDSKLLAPEQREVLFPVIHDFAISIGTGVVSPEIIDSDGMTRAVRLAMKQAIGQLNPSPQFALVDYFDIPDVTLPNKGVTNGDTLCFSIACASIVAKVFRDRLMIGLDRKYPGYGLAHHKGYATSEHLAGLRKLGPSPIHRRSFLHIKNANQLPFSALTDQIDESQS